MHYLTLFPTYYYSGNTISQMLGRRIAKNTVQITCTILFSVLFSIKNSIKYIFLTKQLKTNHEILSAYHSVQKANDNIIILRIIFHSTYKKKLTNRFPATASTSSKNITLFPASRALPKISRR